MRKFKFESVNFDHLYGMQGFSDDLQKNHFSLYQGYVTNTNNLIETLERMQTEGRTQTQEFAELKRRFGWEWNGMKLHELYFGNLTKKQDSYDESSDIARKIQKDFGSHSEWERDFKSTGAMRGIGWVVLYYDGVHDRLWNTWINEHDAGHLAGAEPLLVMDVFEHAFILDYGLKKAGYLEAFFKAISWRTINERYAKADLSKKRVEAAV